MPTPLDNDNNPFGFRAPGGTYSPQNPDAPDPAAIAAEQAAERKRAADESARQLSLVKQGLGLGPFSGYQEQADVEGVTPPPPPAPPPKPQMPQRITHPAPSFDGSGAPAGMRERPGVSAKPGDMLAGNTVYPPHGDGGSPQQGSYSASASAQGPLGLAPIMHDYDEQLAGMQAEREAIGPANEAISGAQGDAADEQRRMADEQMASAREDNSNARRHLDEIGTLVSDYAQQKIDPMKWYHDESFPQKVASVVGAMFAGFAGGPKGAQDYINSQTDRSIALQQDQLNRGAQAIQGAQSLYTGFLRTSENEQQAYDKTRAAMLSSAMIDVQRTATTAKTAQEQAQIDQLMAGLKLQRDMLLARIQAQVSAAGRGGGAAPSANGLEVDPKQIATGSNGQQYLITNAAFSDDISTQLAQFGRLRDSLLQGQAVLDERKNGYDWLLPYSDNIQRGEAIKGAIYETASKLASARGMPAGLQHVVQDLVPSFDSRFAGPTGAAKIPQVIQLLDKYEQDYLKASGAIPSQIVIGPGQGKEAGKLKYYARPGVVTTAPSQSGGAANPLLKSFKPGP